MTDIFALTTRGLEAVSAAELAATPDVSISLTAYRRVTGACGGALAPLLDLRTVDDVYLDAATWTDIRHTRESLAVLQWHAAQLELTAAAEQIAALRPIPPEPHFSVTASFVGRRNYSSDEIKQTVAEGVRSQYAWRYTPDDREADLNLRLFIDHEMAYVGLRLAKHPLHERSYRVSERPGALKPTVAAAMLALAGVQPKANVLDPCCGAGTILIEAAQSGASARGGDNDPEALAAARANIQAAGIELSVEQWDARALPLANKSVTHVVTNLPWGRQIALDDALAGFYHDVCREIERVLIPGGRAALLTTAPQLLRFERLQPSEMVEISLFGQTPTIAVYHSGG